MTSRQKARKIIRGLYPIVDVSYTPDYPAFKLAGEILSSGVGLLQLRQKNIEPEAFLKTAQEISYLKVHNPFCLIINHFVGVAKQLGADGVHLGWTSVSIGEARNIMGAGAIIGASVHSIKEGVQKEKEGADYLTFGSIYRGLASPPHPALRGWSLPPQRPTGFTDLPAKPIQGVEKLREMVEAVKIPVVAIGGITPDRVNEIKGAGAAAFSVISAVSRQVDPAQAAAELVSLSCVLFGRSLLSNRLT
ncbi:MAG: thiamine phosphate synthase [Deltaproteobacteria bacterium]|nr:thiamine phosphate synthase [Deltaproteobacteria bacterium]